jgi:hypothetical protein
MKRYEAHITVERFPTLEQIVRFQFFCVQHGYKCLLIELNRGRALKVQLMCAINIESDFDETALFITNQRVDEIREAGFHVIRVKVESELCKGPAEYFEAHWKYAPGARQTIAERPPQWALASWNLINGAAYLSRRFDSIGQSWQTVQQAFESTGDYLKMCGFDAWEKVHYERVVYDSARNLDAGWEGA